MNRIWTVGHSNRSLDAFLELMIDSEIEHIADVRRFPGSRRHPHFGEESLRDALASRGMSYDHIPELGGRRGKPSDDSLNTAWRVASFAAYADYMATEEFAKGLEALENTATERRTAMMCSEAVPWRCHRRLIADALIIRGWDVIDIFASNRLEKRSLTEFARLVDGKLTYPE